MARPASNTTYAFDGEHLTFEQIRARVPLLKSRDCLHRALGAGRNTRDAVLSATRQRRHRGGWGSEFDFRRKP